VPRNEYMYIVILIQA